jgi:hypothetical protein
LVIAAPHDRGLVAGVDVVAGVAVDRVAAVMSAGDIVAANEIVVVVAAGDAVGALPDKTVSSPPLPAITSLPPLVDVVRVEVKLTFAGSAGLMLP